MLFDRERQTSHVGAAFSREIERKPAPPGTYVEHPLSGTDQELCRYVPFLCELCGVEIIRGVLEISARILPIAVEKQFIELVRQIVMVSDIAPGPRSRIVLIDPPQHRSIA